MQYVRAADPVRSAAGFRDSRIDTLVSAGAVLSWSRDTPSDSTQYRQGGEVHAAV